jgi:hypothetical protein
VKELEAANKIDPSSVITSGLLGYAYARSGNTRGAQTIAQQLESSIGTVSGAAGAAARVYVGLGDKAKALSLLERAVLDRDSFFSSDVLSASYWDSIRTDPRFEGIVTKVGLDRKVIGK